MRNSKRTALILALIALLVCGVAGLAVACTTPTRAPTQNETTWIPPEDCDAEDWANYDSECNRRSPKPAATKAKPTVAKTPTTRRSTR